MSVAENTNAPYQLFDALTDEDYAALKADIAERGVLVPVEVDEHGNILDGHHRVRAWQELRAEGIDIAPYVKVVRPGLSEEQKRNHVRALNILRRHLTKEQRVRLFADMRADGMTLQQIADAAGVGKSTVHRELTDSAFPNGKADLPDATTGRDGKQYPTTYKPRQTQVATPALFTDSDDTRSTSDIPADVLTVAHIHNIRLPEKIDILTRLYKGRGKDGSNGTFDEIDATGGFHYGDDFDKWCDFRTAPVEVISRALSDLSGTHRRLAGEASGTIDPDTGEIISAGRQKPKTNRAGDADDSKPFDRCQTPPEALAPLLPYLNRTWTVWEPAAGEGLLVAGLRDHGLEVRATDILTGHNFFDFTPATWDALVTNPPYSIKYKWLERCYALGKPFALLLPVETLGAQSAQRFFRECGVEIILFDRRINFKMPNIGFEGSSAQFPSAWFTWGLNLGRQLTFAHLEPAP